MKHPRFFVFCLPRSRSAWLANLLTAGEAVCLHEGLVGLRSVAEIEDKLEVTGGEVSGMADTGLISFTQQVIDTYPDARFIVLFRDIEKFGAQMQKIGSSEDDVVDMIEDFQRSVGLLQALGDQTMMVHTSQLDSYEECKKIWRHIGMRSKFNRVRFDMLKDLRVEVVMSRLKAKVNENLDAVRELFEGRDE